MPRHAPIRPPALLITLITLAIEAPARAAVVPSLADRTLTLTGDSAADRIELRSTPTTLLADTGSGPVSFSRAAFDRVVVNGGGGGTVPNRRAS